MTGPAPGPSPAPVERADRVFVNRNLRLSSIDWVGFDMDYTLAVYDQASMDTLSVELTVRHMIERGYPSTLAQLNYDIRFPIRGVLVDKHLGNVLKLNRFKVVHKGYHGTTPIPRARIKELYWNHRVQPNSPRYHFIDTLFGLSEVTAYAAIVTALEQTGEPFDYQRVFQDVRDSIDDAHRSGEVYAAVTSSFSKYVERHLGLCHALHKLRSSGKHLFLLTNSPWSYTNEVMSYLFDGVIPEYQDWRKYFDVVIAAARKPDWFRHDEPFMRRSGDALETTSNLARGSVYEGGNLRDFERMLGLRGSEVLYVGDHIYGDILRSKRESAWRTAMIIQELDDELAAIARYADQTEALRDLEETRARLDDELRFYQARHREAAKQNGARAGERGRLRRATESLRAERERVHREFRRLEAEVDNGFHPYWGARLKERGEMSFFGHQVESYADIYMRKVSCLGHYAADHFFHSPYDLMPHELSRA